MTLLREGHLRLCVSKKWRTVYVMVRQLDDSASPSLNVVYYKKAGDFSPLGSFVIDRSCKLEVLEPPHSTVIKGLPNQTVIRIHSNAISKGGMVMLTNTLTSSTGSDVTLGTITSNGGFQWQQLEASTIEKTTSFLKQLAQMFTQYVTGCPTKEVSHVPCNGALFTSHTSKVLPTETDGRSSVLGTPPEAKSNDFAVPDLLMKG